MVFDMMLVYILFQFLCEFEEMVFNLKIDVIVVNDICDFLCCEVDIVICYVCFEQLDLIVKLVVEVNVLFYGVDSYLQ